MGQYSEPNVATYMLTVSLVEKLFQLSVFLYSSSLLQSFLYICRFVIQTDFQQCSITDLLWLASEPWVCCFHLLSATTFIFIF